MVRPTHAAIINEYDWLWLHRDGTPTALTKKVFDTLLGPRRRADQRLELAGLPAGRADRVLAGAAAAMPA